jgi:hypothetical protein
LWCIYSKILVIVEVFVCFCIFDGAGV